MTSYEIVHRAMTFQKPERIPFSFGSDCVAIGVSAESNKAQFEAFREYGNLKI